ncbi:MAG: hypothetical protein Alpg2KO_23960 [Alphaproteobacteria bacterium]
MDNLTIHQGGKDQAPVIAALVHALLQELSGDKAPTLDALKANADKALSDPRILPFLAMLDDRPVGLMTLRSDISLYATGPYATITELYVHPDFRSHGIAAQLIEVARREGRARDWNRIEVGAPNAQKWARTVAFYRDNGFEEIGPRMRIRL